MEIRISRSKLYKAWRGKYSYKHFSVMTSMDIFPPYRYTSEKGKEYYWVWEVTKWIRKYGELVDLVIVRGQDSGMVITSPSAPFVGTRITSRDLYHALPDNVEEWGPSRRKTWPSFVNFVRTNPLHPAPNSDGGFDGEPSQWWWRGELLIDAYASLHSLRERLGSKYVENWDEIRRAVTLPELEVTLLEYTLFLESYRRVIAI